VVIEATVANRNLQKKGADFLKIIEYRRAESKLECQQVNFQISSIWDIVAQIKQNVKWKIAFL